MKSSAIIRDAWHRCWLSWRNRAGARLTLGCLGLFDQSGDLASLVRLDEPLPIGVGGRVRLIILLAEDEPSEQDWLHAARQGGAFDFLNATDEDRYPLLDGKPFDDAR